MIITYNGQNISIVQATGVNLIKYFWSKFTHYFFVS